MKLPTFKRGPVLITATVLALVGLIQFLPLWFPAFDTVERVEWMTYDWRARQASGQSTLTATNLGVVVIDDGSLEIINKGYGFSYPWPRQLHGQLIQELSAQGAKMVGFDILFSELHLPSLSTNVKLGNGTEMSSDDYFVRQLRKSGQVSLAALDKLLPNELFRTNALTIGDISATKDSDGILRRAKAYQNYRLWHPAILGLAKDLALNLSQVRFENRRLVFLDSKGKPVQDDKNQDLGVALDLDGKFNPSEITGQAVEVLSNQKPFTELRVWHMGIVLAAQELKLDFTKAVIEPRRIILRGQGGVERVIPIDSNGYFFINWTLDVDSDKLQKQRFEEVLEAAADRAEGKPNLSTPWRDKLVVVGSFGTGNNISDQGATPLEKNTFLVSKHWNVANSIINNRFIQRSPTWINLLLIGLFGVAAAVTTWKLNAPWSSVWVAVGVGIYVGVAWWLYVQFRLWIPIVVPVVGALMMNHVCLVTYQVIFEQAEKRRVKGVFAKLVSPNVVNELLGAAKLNLGGGRRKITVFFSDVRGFTEMTDVNQVQAEDYVRVHNLTGEAAEAVFDERARETLATVNVYLATIADQIKKHDGTLDKYIGDCVMAFWGAPTPNEKHALSCVLAAVDAQRAMYALNLKRAEENKRREVENTGRALHNKPPLTMLPLLSLGTGINTGVCIVGLMGSDTHILNYTVFGREVNLASRLEGVSGRGRIIIGESTHTELLRDDPALAATCVELPPVTVKGIKQAVKIFEVPWRQDLGGLGIIPKPGEADSTTHLPRIQM